jgi:hypothetical protein
MRKWQSVMLEGKVRSRKTAAHFIREYGDQAAVLAAVRMRASRRRRMTATALHWIRVAMWIEELKKEPAVKRASEVPQRGPSSPQGRKMELRAGQ